MLPRAGSPRGHKAGRRWTYAESLADTRALATGLLRLGVEPGDRVGIWGPNSWEWVLTQYATAHIGAILVNINPAYRQHELDYVLEQAGISTVISSPKLKTSDCPAMLTSAAERLGESVGGALRSVVVMGTPEWETLLADTEDDALAAATRLTPDDPINIQYTSGTTGRPKGATLTHRNILNNGYFVGELVNCTEADRIVVALPLYHCFGMVMGCLAASTSPLQKKLSTEWVSTCQRMRAVVTVTSEVAKLEPTVRAKQRKSALEGRGVSGKSRRPDCPQKR